MGGQKCLRLLVTAASLFSAVPRKVQSSSKFNRAQDYCEDANQLTIKGSSTLCEIPSHYVKYPH